MTNNQKILFKRLVTGLKQGWNAQVMPNKVVSLHNNILVRIFRVIGGISIVTVLSKNHLLLIFPLNYIILLIALLHFSYITVISIIKLVYGFKVLTSDKFTVKNTPIDRFATSAGKLLYCWKYGCQVGSAGLGLVGTSFMIDSILEAGDKEKIFTPLPKGVKLFVLGKPADQTLIEIKNNIKNLQDSKKTFEEIRNMFNQVEGALDSKDFSKQYIDSIKSTISEIKNMGKSKVTDYAKDLSKKIREYSEKNK